MCRSILQRAFAVSLVLLLVFPPGQARAASPAEQTAQAPGLPPSVSPEETCTGRSAGSACWLEPDNWPGCYFWNPFGVFANMQATWNGACDGGLAEGAGEITLVWGMEQESKITLSGWLRQGKQHGRWVERHDDGTEVEGSCYNGICHGPWVRRQADGTVEKGRYVDGNRDGQWVHRKPDGSVVRKTYMAGELQ